MGFIGILRGLAFALLVVGIGATPLAAQGAKVAAAAADVVTMASMTAEMPCCPNEAPSAPDCMKTCPLLALCMPGYVAAAPATLIVADRATTSLVTLAPADDLARSGPYAGPPSRPPRI
ncbi:hypothetical protein GCM10008171_28820 [Methylopila jiangsuensis]|uniref:Uncharacterized protein n=1 Tax=Methylopila jiangsuensis TaxID=586230 RepID=A0A9W6JK18_9HYPH|nr:hypothetical protein GCM10008171_28820 [Methylopila jiangsuensis]